MDFKSLHMQNIFRGWKSNSLYETPMKWVMVTWTWCSSRSVSTPQ